MAKPKIILLLVVCAILVTVGCDEGESEVVGGDSRQIINKVMFSANASFIDELLYRGTRPESEEGSMREEFADLLKNYGIKSLRFPGGTYANLYMWNSEIGTREIFSAGKLEWVELRDIYITIDEFLDFCKEYAVEPIIQVNASTYWDESGVCLLSKTSTEANMWLDNAYYKGDGNIEYAAENIKELVQHVKDEGYGVTYWEIGNEEYGFPILPAEEYARIVGKYIDAISSIDENAKVLVTLGHGHILYNADGSRDWARSLLKSLKNYENKIDYYTLHYVDKSCVDAATNLMVAEGYHTTKIAITEFDATYKVQYGYSLQLAQYLIEMIRHQSVEVAVIHDLVSVGCGLFYYGEGEVFATPAAYVYKLFAELQNGRPLSILGPKNALEVLDEDSRYKKVIVNDSTLPRSETIDLSRFSRKFTTACVQMIFPDDPDIDEPLCAAEVGAIEERWQITESSVSVEVKPYSITLIVCE